MPATLENGKEKPRSEHDEDFVNTSNISKVQKIFGNTCVDSQSNDDVVNNVSLEEATESQNSKESCSKKNYCQAEVINETEMIKQKENIKDSESYSDKEHGKYETLDKDNDCNIKFVIPDKGIVKLIKKKTLRTANRIWIRSMVN